MARQFPDYVTRNNQPVMVGTIAKWKRRAQLCWSFYKRGNCGVVLFGKSPKTGKTVWVATYNSKVKPAKGCVWIKDHGENEGMLKALSKAKIVEATGNMLRLPDGKHNAYEAKVLWPAS